MRTVDDNGNKNPVFTFDLLFPHHPLRIFSFLIFAFYLWAVTLLFNVLRSILFSCSFSKVVVRSLSHTHTNKYKLVNKVWWMLLRKTWVFVICIGYGLRSIESHARLSFFSVFAPLHFLLVKLTFTKAKKMFVWFGYFTSALFICDSMSPPLLFLSIFLCPLRVSRLHCYCGCCSGDHHYGETTLYQ